MSGLLRQRNNILKNKATDEITKNRSVITSLKNEYVETLSFSGVGYFEKWLISGCTYINISLRKEYGTHHSMGGER